MKNYISSTMKKLRDIRSTMDTLNVDDVAAITEELCTIRDELSLRNTPELLTVYTSLECTTLLLISHTEMLTERMRMYDDDEYSPYVEL